MGRKRLRFKNCGKLPTWEGLALFSWMGIFGRTSLITCPDPFPIRFHLVFIPQLCPKSHVWCIWKDFSSSDISVCMSMPLWTLHLSSGVPCKGWVLPKHVARLFLQPAPQAMHSSPCSAKVHLGWWNMILNKPTFEVCIETPPFCRGYSDHGITFPAEALETVLASCSRCNLTYPNWNVILWRGGSLCHLSLQAPIQGVRSSQQLPGKLWAVSRRLRLRGAKSQNSLVFLVHQRTT